MSFAPGEDMSVDDTVIVDSEPEPSVNSHPEPSVFFEEGDIPYEEDIIRNPYSIRAWLRYIDHKKSASRQQINMVYERALKELPGSYKLWYNYLKIRRKQCRGRCITDYQLEETNNTFERSLVFMHKMPRVWIDYCQFMTDQKLITRTRRIFDRALRALPITQHLRIWPIYLEFVKLHDIPESGLRIYRRYMKISPENAEDFVDYLVSKGCLDEAARKMADVVNNEKFRSRREKSNHQLWMELCELCAKNPTKVTTIQVEPIIRQGIKRYTDQVGQLWCSLADYFIRAGLFERARDIYEEAIQTVITVRDFSQVFDAYAQFTEQIIGARMEDVSHKATTTEIETTQLDLMMARFENLMDRRPLLLNSVLLRQNPHNVFEWHKRTKLFNNDTNKQIDTFTEAVQTVEPKYQTGKLYTLWVAFAKLYEQNSQLQDARMIFEKAMLVPYAKVDELASVWCEYAEMELRLDNHEGALKLLKRATSPPLHKAHYFDETESVQSRVYRSLKLWSLYADLEESFGTYESTKRVYDRIIDLRIATPQILINYGMFLEEHSHFEEMFKAYEKGVALFKWPNVHDIWNTYLTKFIKRYGGKKLERARDLFEQCLEDCPEKFTKGFYLLYAKLEEEHGLARHAMAIYARATDAVLKEEKYDIFNIYIRKAAELYGITHTRPIYEEAINKLTEEYARQMCLRFAELETKLGEIDRARAVFTHCSQMSDPRVHASFWEKWKDFEIKHGNEDTVREMLRIKRSVQATFNTQVNFMSAQMLAASQGQENAAEELTGGDTMALLEAKAQQQLVEETRNKENVMFVRGSDIEGSGGVKEIIRTQNPDEINLDDDDEEMLPNEEDGPPKKKANIEVEKQSVPSEVFGSLAPEDDD